MNVRNDEVLETIEAPFGAPNAGGESFTERRSDVPDAEAETGPSLGSAIGLLFVAIGFLVGSRAIGDNSFFTHFATGRIILDTGSVPTTDPYSASAAGLDWTVQSWLASVVYAGLEAYLGEWSVQLFNGLACSAIVALLWYFSRDVINPIVRVFLVGLPLVIGSGVWSPRPLLIGLVGLGVIVAMSLGAQRERLWLIVPLMWIWANSHGSFPLAGVAAGTIMVGTFLDTRRLPTHQVKVLGWVCVGTIVAALNPLGVKLLTFPIHLLGRREALEGVKEWAPLGFAQPFEVVFWVFLAATLGIGIYHRSWTALVPTVVFGLSAMMAVRNVATAAIVIVAVIAPHLQSIPTGLAQQSRGTLPKALGAGSVALVAVACVLIGQPGAVQLSRYPVGATNWLEQRDLVANPDVVLIQRDFVGNYLELRYGENAGVFVDDRFDFFPLDVNRDHTHLIVGGDYDEILERRGADVVLWEADAGLSSHLDGNDAWALAYSDEDWSVYCRVDAAIAGACDINV